MDSIAGRNRKRGRNEGVRGGERLRPTLTIFEKNRKLGGTEGERLILRYREYFERNDSIPTQ